MNDANTFKQQKKKQKNSFLMVLENLSFKRQYSKRFNLSSKIKDV